MKSYTHPEFFLLTEMRQLQKKYADISEIESLVERTKEIINGNCISMQQYALLYTVVGGNETLKDETKWKLCEMLINAAASFVPSLSSKEQANVCTRLISAAASFIVSSEPEEQSLLRSNMISSATNRTSSLPLESRVSLFLQLAGILYTEISSEDSFPPEIREKLNTLLKGALENLNSIKNG